jgi:DNA mismatch repair ATPase MutL
MLETHAVLAKVCWFLFPFFVTVVVSQRWGWDWQWLLKDNDAHVQRATQALECAQEDAASGRLRAVVLTRMPVVCGVALNGDDLKEFIDSIPASTSVTASVPPVCGDWRTTSLYQMSRRPPALHRILCLRACRGAIMFGLSAASRSLPYNTLLGDQLDVPDCEKVIAGLKECTFPFICAHGRPSMSPLIVVGSCC